MIGNKGITYQLLFIISFFAFVQANDSIVMIDTVGWDIYPAQSYHYGPSILIHPDTTIETWTTAPGYGWDYICYKKSTDKGVTWTTPQIALTATAGSEDAFSNADPGVTKIDSFYYIAYTSTMDSRGTDNDVYVARSKKPTGPFEKWNGYGWGGNPVGFIRYTDNPAYYGAGEPALVRKGDTIFIYYTWISDVLNQTRVAVASAKDPNWPGHITQMGVAIHRGPGEDSHDIKYCDSLGMFIGVAVGLRMSASSKVTLWFSSDGFHFKQGYCTNTYTRTNAHNAGISGTLQDGHMDLRYPTFVGYAYGTSWGNWPTYFAPVRLSAIGSFTGPTSAPTGLVAAMAGRVTVKVSWDSVSQASDPESGIRSYIIYRDGQRIGFADTTFFLDSLVSESTPYTYTVAALNTFGMAGPLSSDVAFTTSADMLPPTVRSVQTDKYDATKIKLLFSEKVDAVSSQNISNYGLDNGASIQSAQIMADSITVQLLVSPLSAGSYHLTVSGVKDKAVVPNDTTETISFTYVAGNLGACPVSGELPRLSAAASSTVNTSWPATNAIGNAGCWSSANSGQVGNQWIYVDFGNNYRFSQIKVVPRWGSTSAYCFPQDFKFQTAVDSASGWVDIPGLTKSGYPNPTTASGEVFTCEPVIGRYLRMVGSKFRPDNYNVYMMQIDEIYAYCSSDSGHTLTETTPQKEAAVLNVSALDKQITIRGVVSGKYQLGIFDIRGRQVVSLGYRESRGAFRRTVKTNGTGVYFVRLLTGGKTFINKVVVF